MRAPPVAAGGPCLASVGAGSRLCGAPGWTAAFELRPAGAPPGECVLRTSLWPRGAWPCACASSPCRGHGARPCERAAP